MISGTLISLLLYPLDTMKRAAQLDGGLGFKKLYSGPLQLVQQLPKDIGFTGLYRGASMFTLS